MLEPVSGGAPNRGAGPRAYQPSAHDARARAHARGGRRSRRPLRQFRFRGPLAATQTQLYSQGTKHNVTLPLYGQSG